MGRSSNLLDNIHGFMAFANLEGATPSHLMVSRDVYATFIKAGYGGHTVGKAGCCVYSNYGSVWMLPSKDLKDEEMYLLQEDSWAMLGDSPVCLSPGSNGFMLIEGPGKPKNCECGADKVNSSHHSTWCQKHIDRQSPR